MAESVASACAESPPAVAGTTFPSVLRSQPLLALASFSSSTVALAVLLPVLVRGLGTSAYGAWALTGGLVSYVSVIDLGLGVTVTRYVARHRWANPRFAEEAFTIATVALAGVGLAIIFVGIAVAPTAGHQLGVPGGSSAVRAASVAAALMLVSRASLAALEGIGRVAMSKAIQGGGAVAFAAVAVCAVLVKDAGLRQISWILVVSSGLTLGVSVGVLSLSWERRLPLARPRALVIAEVLRYGAGAQASSVLATCVDPCARILLGAIAGPAAVTPFDLAVRARAQIFGAAASLLSPLLPAMGKADARGSRGADIGRFAWQKFVPVSVVAVVFAAAVALFGFPIVFGGSVGRTAGELAAASLVLWIPSIACLVPYLMLVLYGTARDLIAVQATTSLIGLVITGALLQGFDAWAPVLGLGAGAVIGAAVTYGRYRRLPGASRLSVRLDKTNARLFALTPIALAALLLPIGAAPALAVGCVLCIVGIGPAVGRLLRAF